MLTKNMNRIYRRWIILGILSVCVGVFGYSDAIESVYAAPCIQECETNLGTCRHECTASCSDIDSICSSCLVACNVQFNNCMGYAVWCENSEAQPGQCGVNFGTHCPRYNGVPDCTVPSNNHNGYSMTCPALGDQHCIHCPPNEYCAGTGDLPPC